MPPSIYQTALDYKRQLANREATIMRQMATRWLTVMNALDADMQDLARIVAARRAAGLPVGAGYIYRNERYLALLHQSKAQFDKFADPVTASIVKNQAVFARLGRESAIKELELATGGIKGSFERINPEIAENVAAFLSDTSPLKTLLEDAWPNSVQQTTSALVRGINLGYGPERVAKMMAAGMSTALNRAMLIARTETMRVYRTTKFETWEATGIVSGYKRIATHDSRACPSCLFLDGEIIKSPSDFAEHPQGRCTVIPLVKGAKEPKWTEGPEWFEKQPESVQKQILGVGKHEAWKDGKFNLRDIPQVVDNPTWGKSLRVRSLAELTGGVPPRVVVPPVQPPTPVVVQSSARPLGPKASEVMDVYKPDKNPKYRVYDPVDDAIMDEASRALRIMDEVHGLPDAPLDHNIGMTDNSRRSFGGFSPAASRFTPTSKITSITINKPMVANRLEQTMPTMVHEMGHWIDYHVLGKGTGFASELKSEVISNVQNAIENSANRQHLRAVLQNPGDYNVTAGFAKYVNEDAEILARAYTQFIAEESGDAVLLAEIANDLRDTSALKMAWTTEDFAPIRQSFRDMFKAIGAME